jgi:hypothetical protein
MSKSPPAMLRTFLPSKNTIIAPLRDIREEGGPETRNYGQWPNFEALDTSKSTTALLWPFSTSRSANIDLRSDTQDSATLENAMYTRKTPLGTCAQARPTNMNTLGDDGVPFHLRNPSRQDIRMVGEDGVPFHLRSPADILHHSFAAFMASPDLSILLANTAKPMILPVGTPPIPTEPEGTHLPKPVPAAKALTLG